MQHAGQSRFGNVRGRFLTVPGIFLAFLLVAPPAEAAEMSREIAALYSTVSIYPPSAKSMTVCYGFVCRRREVLDFTLADRNALTQIMAAGPAAGGGEGAAAPEGVGGVRPPHGP